MNLLIKDLQVEIALYLSVDEIVYQTYYQSYDLEIQNVFANEYFWIELYNKNVKNSTNRTFLEGKPSDLYWIETLKRYTEVQEYSFGSFEYSNKFLHISSDYVFLYYLLKNKEISSQNGINTVKTYEYIYSAAKKGFLQSLKWLYKTYSPAFNYGKVIIEAIEHNRLKIVQWLFTLPEFNEKYKFFTLEWSIRSETIDILEWVIQIFPDQQWDWEILIPVLIKHDQLKKIILEFPDYDWNFLELLKHTLSNEELFDFIYQRKKLADLDINLTPVAIEAINFNILEKVLNLQPPDYKWVWEDILIKIINKERHELLEDILAKIPSAYLLNWNMILLDVIYDAAYIFDTEMINFIFKNATDYAWNWNEIFTQIIKQFNNITDFEYLYSKYEEYNEEYNEEYEWDCEAFALLAIESNNIEILEWLMETFDYYDWDFKVLIQRAISFDDESIIDFLIETEREW
jgi:hypothetical protein